MKQTMTIKPVFDGGCITEVSDGVISRNRQGEWVIQELVSGRGWIVVRPATEAEITAAQRLREAFFAGGRRALKMVVK